MQYNLNQNNHTFCFSLLHTNKHYYNHDVIVNSYIIICILFYFIQTLSNETIDIDSYMYSDLDRFIYLMTLAATILHFICVFVYLFVVCFYATNFKFLLFLFEIGFITYKNFNVQRQNIQYATHISI